jgi:hypothetical protein
VNRVESIQAPAQIICAEKQLLRIQYRSFYIVPSLLPTLPCAPFLVCRGLMDAVL